MDTTVFSSDRQGSTFLPTLVAWFITQSNRLETARGCRQFLLGPPITPEVASRNSLAFFDGAETIDRR